MARKIDSRIKVTGTLIAQSPIHVGGINDNPEVDLTIAVNGQGHYYIPGTSLAGAFRNWMQMYTGSEHFINGLWGFQEKKGGNNGHASFILIEDAIVQGAVLEIRDGVGINRFSGTAAEQAKYDRAILTRGSKINLDITFEVTSKASADWSKYQKLFFQLIDALQHGEIRLGAAKTRGLGKVKLLNAKVIEQDLLTHSGIIQALQNQGNVLNLSQLTNQITISSANPILDIVINWTPQSPLMVKAEGDGIAVDILPLVSAVDSSVTFVLPGSSVKGTLRSQAERIIRTVRNLTIPNDSNNGQTFIQQVEVALVKDIFGTAAKNEGENQFGKIGSLSVDDCYANIPISVNDWENIKSATNETNLIQVLNRANLTNTQQVFHVAVDRWTGGAAEGFLYTTLEPMGISWQPLRLSLNLGRLESNSLPALALLLLVLRDLSQRKIPLGYATNRGMGAIKVDSISIQGRNLDEALSAFLPATLNNGNIATLHRKFLDQLNKAWQQWIELPTTNNG
ncbi:protein of unknown function DUF324 [Crinalium epipsammum PCC 9333]|uniref:CRISPR type III-associated protein domain-containing protein n=1 Tax=Crinalium epipsammum PCC 9333 TaxID=1173022 RepID=K9VVM8_9CYAN|nr:RAMP superfamily CRISPR-associated protein [Crinalium epipsammum]AFZ11527.1 protein of unknown function DUF324 [Crinalium epipsammum PCC 9333]